MRPSQSLFLGFSVFLLATSGPAAADKASDEQRAADTRDAIRRFQERDSTLEACLEKLVGYAVFPEVAKGGFIVGGTRGRGEVYAGGRARAQRSLRLQGPWRAQVSEREMYGTRPQSSVTLAA